MGRVSQAQAQENRRRVVETASRLFREQGTHVSVADLMKAAGLTHGGFYKQFASKDALVDEATALALKELARHHGEELRRHDGERAAAQRELINTYLSPAHRDGRADGCPVAALVTDIAREPEGREVRRVYAQGVRDFAGHLATSDGEDGLTRLCTMVGALVLARATSGDPLSQEILDAARAALGVTAEPGRAETEAGSGGAEVRDTGLP
ncbi:TetR/AcrR family transcriptional regulator [Cryptosporangium aurantiacum]|uniref:Transcriptional regulator, TetR family n=1 Tax=Cryptosporangium aurantiacum TaxID=134849 RepID=A0A1M7PD51_9ACTN|nr:TetR/AcrR family transcriptional regulator [Cryptosporangium aurantiacum]SHN14855.1 transcriptional regulator, TetR family [Cryptosporangium aurantiacum]